MSISCYLVEAALYGGVLGIVILGVSLIMGASGLLIYLMFGW
jgi:hypothetical protein